MNTDLTGKLLIAMPAIGDKRFDRSVILICAHETDYAMGIVLNNPVTHLTLPTLLDQLDVPMEIQVPEHTVLDGGPVGNDRGFVLHSEDFKCDGATMDVTAGCRMTATREILLAMGSARPPEQAVLALGYSGWGAGQLELELAENAWLVGTPDSDLVFGEDYDEKWDRALSLMGIDPGRLMGGSGQA